MCLLVIKTKKMKIDLDHYKICLINNVGIQKKIEYLLREEFNKYCKNKENNLQRFRRKGRRL